MAIARRTESLTLDFGNAEEEETPRKKLKSKTMSDWANKGMHRVENPRPKVVPAARHGRAVVESEEMARSGDWDKAEARHLVALFDILHARIYGVEALDLGPQERYQATRLAGLFTHKHFGGEVSEVVEFMRWVWNREGEQEKWRRENRKPGRRIGFRLMFSTMLLTDYRLAMARQR